MVRLKSGSTWAEWLNNFLFQFQMVRLKSYGAFNGSLALKHVSIPNGSIKINQDMQFTSDIVEFQFQMVRLKL